MTNFEVELRDLILYWLGKDEPMERIEEAIKSVLESLRKGATK